MKIFKSTDLLRIVTGSAAASLCLPEENFRYSLRRVSPFRKPQSTTAWNSLILQAALESFFRVRNRDHFRPADCWRAMIARNANSRYERLTGRGLRPRRSAIFSIPQTGFEKQTAKLAHSTDLERTYHMRIRNNWQQRT